MSGFYPQETIDRVRESIDIVSVISSYLPLKKSGANYTALCPFHTEKTASFSVSQPKQIYHCFGCGEGGNVISFVMKYESKSFVDALQMLADRGGIALPKKKDEGDYTRLYEINRQAGLFYGSRLKSAASSGTVASYIRKRKIMPETVEKFSIGYAPDSWDACFKFLLEKKFSPTDISKAGIIKKSSSGNFIDRFRNRLIFPVVDERNRIVAFGGRTLGGGNEPKYLNSPESPIYYKGRVIYGLNVAGASIRKKEQALIVEGYMDAISLHQAGVDNVVASSGTAFTPHQCRILKRFTTNFVMIFDGDEAGRKAAGRATKIAIENQLRPKVAMVPHGTDPDDLASSGRIDEFKKIVEEAKPYMSYLIDTACRNFDITRPEGKADAAKSLLPELGAIEDPIERAGYVQSLSERLGIPAGKIESRLSSDAAQAPIPLRRRKAAQEQPMEKVLIRIMLDHPEIKETGLKELTPETFENPLFRKMFEQIKEKSETAQDLVDGAGNEELKSQMRALMMESSIYDEESWEKNVEDCLLRIKSRSRKEVIEEMKQAVGSGRRDEYLARQKSFHKIE